VFVLGCTCALLGDHQPVMTGGQWVYNTDSSLQVILAATTTTNISFSASVDNTVDSTLLMHACHL
jgi:hypothetical protein